MAAYYNEHDTYAAEWLRKLIHEGLIADGEVDQRSIVDVRPIELIGFTQCHFFAGIGGWSHALRLAGWPDERPVWTGSCPCQPFSVSGKGQGTDDDRHLWPELYRLINQCRPPVVFGEQVASPLGLEWLDLVSADLEASDYAFGASDLCAAGVAAPHIRQRLYWVGQSANKGLQGFAGDGDHIYQSGQFHQNSLGHLATSSDVDRMANTDGNGCGQGQRYDPPTGYGNPTASTGDNGTADTVNGFWGDADWLFCRDGKWRPVESGTFPLADGIPARVGRLRGYGNAIVPQIAAEFIKAFLDVNDNVSFEF